MLVKFLEVTGLWTTNDQFRLWCDSDSGIYHQFLWLCEGIPGISHSVYHTE